ncbi:MAG: coxB [Rhodospirillales bacterium]|nr:coxB [Rhodospirillales bacterium]
MSYLSGAGVKADPVVALTWGVLVISIAVVIIVSILLLAGIQRGRSRVAAVDIELQQVERRGNALALVYWGTAISTVVLFGALVWTVAVLAAINAPHAKPMLTIEVTGLQWWWKVRYLSDDPSRTITTANEIHIPTGQPVRVRLIGADVIHSFWIPALTGKTDTIPGQTNVTWLEAQRPGVYRGQCTEYCGEQHAHMAAFVVADTPDVFQTWWNDQLRPAAQPTTAQEVQGQVEVQFRCGACHMVRGTDAGGSVAPDLTHLMSRKTIAAGTLDNTIANLAGWIANPQAIKPGTRMPVLNLSGQEVSDITTYLQLLK